MELTKEEKEYIKNTFGTLFEEYYDEEAVSPGDLSDDEFGDLLGIGDESESEDIEDDLGKSDKKLSKDEALDILYGIGEKLPGRKQQEFFDALEEITDMGEEDEAEFYGEEDLDNEI